MVSVLAPPDAVEPLLGGDLAIAAVNGPGTCVAAGPMAAVERLERALGRAGLEFRRIRSVRAGHSPLLDPHLDRFERAVRACGPRAPELRVVSSVTGTWLTPAQAADPAYWRRQLRDTVRFSDALSSLLSAGRCAAIEAGPGGALAALVRQHPAAAGHAVVTTSPAPSPRGRPRRPLDALGEAWLAGVPIDWQRFRAGERRRRVPLPTYSFERERHWIDAVPDEPSAPRPLPPAAPARPDAEPGARPTAADAPRSEVERELVACFQELFRAGSIGVRDNFFSLGGDSLLAVRLLAIIARRLDVRLSMKALVEAPTIAELAERIGGPASSPASSPAAGAEAASAPTAASAPAAAPSCLVRLLAGSRAAPPIFFVHGGGGRALVYRALARAIDPERTMYGFESKGLDGGEPLHSVEEMAAHYAEVARAAHPGGPYLLVGSSLGGMIAYEMARILSAGGHPVPLCALLDAPGPGYTPDSSSDDADILAFFAGRRLSVGPAELRRLPLDERLQLLLDDARRTGGDLAFSDVAGGRLMMRVWKNNFDAMCRYQVPEWPGGEVQYYAAAEPHHFVPNHLERAWIGRCPIRVEVSPGDHLTMMLPPHAAALGAKIRGRLEVVPRAEPAPPARAAGSVEETIAGYWKELLGAEAVSPSDDFIALGGNSMLASMLANRIEDELGVRPDVVELFATLGHVAGVCRELLDGAGGRPEKRGEP
jgi:thioesterase domain-containing protein/malonyl CoA-acyl carrier protein transacylase